MSDKPKAAARSLFSLLDITVAIVSVILVTALMAAVYTGSPERKGAVVAYLSPAYGGVQNIWIASVSNPADALQVTHSKLGIYNFGVSPDGRLIAFAERDETTGLNELKLLNLQTRQIHPLTNCVAENADCRTPVFRPGSDVIAYERQNVNDGIPGVSGSLGAIRIWLLDLTTQPYSTRPLSDDSQFIGHSPQWSLSGDTLAFYSAELTNPGIMVYNFAPNAGEKSLKFVPANNGSVGTLSPNGRQLVFPDITEREGRIYTYLRVADMDALEFVTLTGENEPIDDTAAAWNPAGTRLAIERRYNDERHTRGYQLYQFDPTTQQTDALVVDDRYSHGFFEWNSTGDKLVLQRFRLLNADGTLTTNTSPEIWVKDLTSGELILVTENAFHPRWVLP